MPQLFEQGRLHFAVYALCKIIISHASGCLKVS